MTTAEPQTRPGYLGLLNAISLAESRAGVYLKAWADVTPDPELKGCLMLVASRESTHGEVFRQRIERLGFSVRDREDPEFAEKLKRYGDASISDMEKIGREPEASARGEQSDPLAALEERLNDNTMDSLTRDTLRWFIAEERDTGELVRSVYASVRARANA